MQRCIAHVDLDAFFAAVEQRDNPSLRGKPVVVGGDSPRAVVSACSYEARKFGVRSAMPMYMAKRLCPSAVIVPHRFDAYAAASAAFRKILDQYSPAVEPLSFDEAFLDLTGTERLLGPPLSVGQRIKAQVRHELDLVASVGIAPIKFAAKIASDLRKPDGLCIVSQAELIGFLHGLPVERLWGVGEVAAKTLHGLGLQTIGEVARYPTPALIKKLGQAQGQHIAALARGEDARPVEESRLPATVGHRETFDQDQTQAAALVPVLLSQADRIASRLRALGLRACQITLHLTFDDFRKLTKQAPAAATSDSGVIAELAVKLLRTIPITATPGEAVRLCGVTAGKLAPADAPQQVLFAQPSNQKAERLGETRDKISQKFGDLALQRAVHLDRPTRSTAATKDAPAANGAPPGLRRRRQLTPDE